MKKSYLTYAQLMSNRRREAENAAISGIPPEMKKVLDKAQREHEAKGGCPGCGSKVLGCHTFPCPELSKPDFY